MDSTLIVSEFLLLAKQIGLDPDIELKDYHWFLNMLLQIPLPKFWSKTHDPETGQILYQYIPDDKEPTISKTHPLINAFRGVLKEYLLKTSKKTHLKDWPSYESLQRPSKQQNSKKTSKFSKNNVPDSLMPLYDEGPSKSRFLALKQVLNKPEEKPKNYVSCPIEISEELLNENLEFYGSMFGFDIMELFNKIPKEYPRYLDVDPDELLDNLVLFKISSKENYLFWIVRFYSCLQLSDEWSGCYIPTYKENVQKYEVRHDNDDDDDDNDNDDKNEEEDHQKKSIKKTLEKNGIEEISHVFVNKKMHIYMHIHPGYRYIERLIELSKAVDNRLKTVIGNKAEVMVFRDRLFREFQVNIGEMLNQREIAKTEKIPLKDEVDDKEMENDKKEDYLYPDELLIEISKQLNLDLNKEMHLLAIIHEFLMAKVKKMEVWKYKRLSKGQIYWINHQERKAVNIFPYISELRPIIEKFRKDIAIEYGKYILDHEKEENPTYDDIIRFFKLKKLQQIMLISRKESHNFIRQYLEFQSIHHKKTNKSFNYTTQYLSKYLRNPQNISIRDLQNIIFHSPFTLQDNPREYQPSDHNDSPDNIAIKFIDNSSFLNNKKEDTSLLGKFDVFEDLENFDMEDKSSISFSTQQIDEKHNDLMENVILVIINNKYVHLSENLKNKLIQGVEDDIRLILPYLLHLLEAKGSIAGESNSEEDKEDTHLIMIMKEIFEDSKANDQEFQKKLLQTLEYKYFELGLIDLFPNPGIINMGLIRKINRFIFHKYREIILNEFIQTEDLDKLGMLDYASTENEGIIDYSSSKSISIEDSLVVLDKNDVKSAVQEPSISVKNPYLPTINIHEPPQNLDRIPPNLDIFSLKEISVVLSPNQQELKVETPKKLPVAGKKTLKRLEKNHFMKQIVRMTMEEKKIRRRFADLMKRNPATQNRLHKDFDDYTLSELKEAVANLEKAEEIAAKQRKDRKKAEKLKRQMLPKIKDLKGIKPANKVNMRKSFPPLAIEKLKSPITPIKKRLTIIKPTLKDGKLATLEKFIKKSNTLESIHKEIIEENDRNRRKTIIKEKPLEITTSDKNLLKFPVIPIKRYPYLKRKKKPLLAKLKQLNSDNGIASSFDAIRLENADGNDYENNEENDTPKKIPIAFKFSPKKQFSDFYDYSEKKLEELESKGSYVKKRLNERKASFSPKSNGYHYLRSQLSPAFGVKSHHTKEHNSLNNHNSSYNKIEKMLRSNRSLRSQKENKDIYSIKLPLTKTIECSIDEILNSSRARTEDNVDFVNRNAINKKIEALNQRKLPIIKTDESLQQEHKTIVQSQESNDQIDSSSSLLKRVERKEKEELNEEIQRKSKLKPLFDAKTNHNENSSNGDRINTEILKSKGKLIKGMKLKNLRKFDGELLTTIPEEINSTARKSYNGKNLYYSRFKDKFNLSSWRNNDKDDGKRGIYNKNNDIFSPIHIKGFKTLEALSKSNMNEIKVLFREKNHEFFNAFKNSSEKKIRPSSPTKRKALNLPLYKSPFVIKIDRDFQLKGNSCLVKDIGSKNSILNPQNSRKNESDKEGKKKMKSIEKEKEYQMKRMVLRQRTKSFCDLKAYFKNYEISQYINKIPFRKSI